jgi:hypothetical protein
MLLQQKRLRQARAAADARLVAAAIAQAQGERGEKGAKGDKGDTGPMPSHQWQGTKLRFELPTGAWGKWVDLRGPAGARGGSSGSATIVKGFDPNAVQPTTTVEAGDEMFIRRGTSVYRIGIQLSAGSGVPANAVTVNGQAVVVNGQYVVKT